MLAFETEIRFQDRIHGHSRVRLRPSLCLEAKKRSNQMIAFANTLWYNSSTKKEGGIAMANTLVQFRADETSRIKAVGICEKLGIDLATYLRMCISRLVQENGIPFSMKVDDISENRGMAAMKEASRIAAAEGIADMTLDEINEEIAETRKLS